ncbi:hypothetical protein J6S88_07765 [bacterium]|nr:hypothetical protein [bacterium]
MTAHIITIILSVVSGVLVYIVQNLLKENEKLRREKRDNQEKKQKAIGNGVLSLLKIQLIEYHDKYMQGQNIPTYVYENWDEMYSAYEALGGNGMVKRMKDDIDRLRLGGNGK